MLTLKLQTKDYYLTLTLLPPPHKWNLTPFQSKVKTKVFSKLNTLDLSLVFIAAEIYLSIYRREGGPTLWVG